MTPDTLSALRLDPRTPREWYALELASDGSAVTYRGRRTDDDVVLVSGGTLPAPLAIEADPLTILRTLALDVVARHPDWRLDAEAMALDALTHMAARLNARVWSVSEIELVAD